MLFRGAAATGIAFAVGVAGALVVPPNFPRPPRPPRPVPPCPLPLLPRPLPLPLPCCGGRRVSPGFSGQHGRFGIVLLVGRGRRPDAEIVDDNDDTGRTTGAAVSARR